MLDFLFKPVIFQSEEVICQKCAEAGFDSFQCTLAYGFVGAFQFAVWLLIVMVILAGVLWLCRNTKWYKRLTKHSTNDFGPK